MHHLPTRQRPVRILLAATASLAIAASLFAGAGSARPAHAANNPFTGSWGRHGFTLNVAGDGSASATWRVYSWCSDDPTPPCDDLRGNQIVPGGQAQLDFDGFSDIEGDTLYGSVLNSTDGATLPAFGDASLTLLPYGMAELDTDAGSILLCGPQFSRLAPPDVRAQAPCGA